MSQDDANAMVEGPSETEWFGPGELPYCIQWGTFIPNMNGPYGSTWAAHNNCAPHKHGWFRSQNAPMQETT